MLVLFGIYEGADVECPRQDVQNRMTYLDEVSHLEHDFPDRT